MNLLPITHRSVRIGSPFVLLFILLQNKARIHVVIHIVNTQIPDSLASIMLPVKIEAQVQSMAGRQTIVVPRSNEIGIAERTGRGCHHNPPFRKRGYTAGSKTPSDAQIKLLIEFVIQHKINIVSAVITVRKALSVVDGRE